jgi:hypothetical protein
MFSNEAIPPKAAVYLMTAALVLSDDRNGRFAPGKVYDLSMEMIGLAVEEIGRLYPPQAA